MKSWKYRIIIHDDDNGDGDDKVIFTLSGDVWYYAHRDLVSCTIMNTVKKLNKDHI